jgi:hypothetical protein
MPAKGSEIVDIGVEIKHETEKAWLVVSFITNRQAWIPKSVGEMSGYEKSNRTGTLTLPTNYATDKELV